MKIDVTPLKQGSKVRAYTVSIGDTTVKGTGLAGIVASLEANGIKLDEVHAEGLEACFADAYASKEPASVTIPEAKPPKPAKGAKGKPAKEAPVLVEVKPDPKPAKSEAPKASAPKVKPGHVEAPTFTPIAIPKPHAEAWKMFASLPTVVCSDVVEGEEAEGMPAGCLQAGCDVAAMKRCKMIATHLNETKTPLTHESLIAGRKTIIERQEEALKLLR